MAALLSYDRARLNEAKSVIVDILNDLSKTTRNDHGAGTKPDARGHMMLKIAECHHALAAIARLTNLGHVDAPRYDERAEDAGHEAANLLHCFREGDTIPSGYLSQYFRDAAGNHTPIYGSEECN